MHHMDMLDHIARHSITVCHVAVTLIDRLCKHEVHLDRNLVRASALLHDITKTRSLTTHENHAHTGAQVLSDMGYPDVGAIVGQHVKLPDDFISKFPDEAAIVHYADKRVLHDHVVSLDERMTYILERYGQQPEHRPRIYETWDMVRALEHRLCEILSTTPDDLRDLVSSEACKNDMSLYHTLSFPAQENTSAHIERAI